MAFDLFKKALIMLWENKGDALRVSLIPLAITMIVTITAALIVLGEVGPMPNGLNEEALMKIGENPATWLAIVIIFAFYIVCASWAAVGWHRYVLLDEKPKGFIPTWHSGEIKSYAVYMVMLCLIALGFAVIFGNLGVNTGPLTSVFLFATIVLVTAIFYTLSIGLPGCAIGNRISIRESWVLGRPHFKEMLFLAVIYIGFNIGLLILGWTLAVIPILGLFAEIAIRWFGTMLAISLLTALYGVIVQKRGV